MENNYSIRQLNSDDWQLFREMRLRAVSEFSNYFLDNASNCEARDESFWREMLSKDDCAIFGLFDKNTHIGITGAFRWKESREDTVILGMSYLLANYRGRGLSRLFYEARINWAKEQKGINRIIVSHRQENAASKAANQNFGFQYYESEEITFGDGSKGLDIRYELKI